MLASVTECLMAPNWRHSGISHPIRLASKKTKSFARLFWPVSLLASLQPKD